MSANKIKDTLEIRVQVASVIGKVKDRETKKAVSGVSIHIINNPSKETITDEAGMYCISDLDVGRKYSIKAKIAKYKTEIKSIMLTKANIKDLVTYKKPFICDFELDPIKK